MPDCNSLRKTIKLPKDHYNNSERSLGSFVVFAFYFVGAGRILKEVFGQDVFWGSGMVLFFCLSFYPLCLFKF